MKRIIQSGLRGLLVLSILSGCSQSPKSDEVSVKNLPMKPQTVAGITQQDALATVTDIQKTAVAEKPEASRVIMTLNKKASYATSRQGNQLVINIFGAQMTSSLKQLELSDPLVKSVVAKQVGNSVKGVIELVNPDIAYTPSTTIDPFQIVLDIWPISSKMSMAQPAPEQAKPVVLEPVQKLEVNTAAGSAQEVQNAPAPVQTPPPPVLTDERSSTQDAPTWFSEKISEVLQEREKIKEELVEVEKNVAIKDSMIQVLERKLKEANLRIVELEEDIIKAKSRVSLVEQNEQVTRSELQQLLIQVEQASGGAGVVAFDVANSDELKTRSQQIVSKISALQKESMDLTQAQAQVVSLKSQIDALVQERDALRQQQESSTSQLEVLKAENSQRLAMVQEELHQKDLELTKLRKAIGDAAKLVMMTTPEQPVTVTVSQPPVEQPQPVIVPSLSGKPSESSQPQPSPPSSAGGLELDTLLQQYQSDSPKVYIMGAVKQPGYYELSSDQRLSGVLQSAGGPISFDTDVRVLRMPKQEFIGNEFIETSAPIVVDLKKLFEDGDQTQNIVLQDGDILMVAAKNGASVGIAGASQTPDSQQFYVVGGVAKPGIYPYQSNDTILDAILRAGGLTQSASPNNTKLVRESDGKTRTIQIKMKDVMEKGEMSKNVPIMPGDMIIVPESSF